MKERERTEREGGERRENKGNKERKRKLKMEGR